jgi:hypothetical protein
MVITRAGLIGQQQRQCQCLVRKRKGVSQQQEHVNGVNTNPRSDEVKYGSRTWWGMSVRGSTKWNMADQSDGVCRGVCMSVWGATKWNTADRSDGACRGACMTVREATKWNTADRSDRTCRGMLMSVSRATKWNRADQLDRACRGACTSVKEQHVENGTHHLNLLLLNHFSSNFVFVITYHAARQIIERTCHLLSHALHNSKLTTLPQSKIRWQPSWQRILEARQIIERLAKDPVTLFRNMSLFILGHA